MAGAEAPIDLIDFIGPAEAVPFYKAFYTWVFHQRPRGAIGFSFFLIAGRDQG